MTRSGGWSWGAFGASVVVHGAALAPPLGHPSTVTSEPVGRPATVTVDLVPMPPLDPATSDRSVERAAFASSLRRHAHPYPVPASHDWTPHAPSLLHVFTATPTAPVSSAVASPEAAAPTADPLLRFSIAIGARSAGPGQASTSAGDGRAGDVGPIESEQSVSTPARLVRGVAPRYPNEARVQSVEADLPLEVVVSARGAVESARLLGHAAYGFDEAAFEAIRRYRFEPATRDGHAVRVRMQWTMEFRLR